MKNRFFVLAISLLVLSCYSRPLNPPAEYAINDAEEIEVIPRYTVTFVAAGDNLFHDSTIRSGYVNGEYNFSPIYSEIRYIIENADLAFVNQETVMAGTSFGYTGFPVFNTPQALGPALVEAGFDIISLANNHAMDMRAPGLYATLDFLESLGGLTIIGARREGESARIITRNNIRLGFLAYTFSLNGFVLPRDNPNLVSMIDRDVMRREIEALRPLCDFLIVSMHWGEEYRLQPDRSQVSLAHFLAELNVDLVIGHHPHVLQRVETLPRPDGGETLVFYSLGNFVSAQRERERLIGGLAVLTFVKEGTSPPVFSITDVGVIPVITHYNHFFRETRIYPLYAYTEEKLLTHGFRGYDPTMTMEFFHWVTERLQTRVIMYNPFIASTDVQFVYPCAEDF